MIQDTLPINNKTINIPSHFSACLKNKKYPLHQTGYNNSPAITVTAWPERSTLDP